MDLTRMDLASLQAYEAALETFISNVKKRCSDMHSGISNANVYMKDPTSQTILTKSTNAVQDIEGCLPAAQKLLERVREVIEILTNQINLGL